MKYFLNNIEKLLIFLYSFIFCLRIFPFKLAIKLPIYIHPQIKLGSIRKGCIILKGNNIYRGMIKIGFYTSEGLHYSSGYLSIHNQGLLIFEGSATFAKGSSIRIDKGKMVVGNNFYCNANCFFRCTDLIRFGENVLIGWDVSFNTTDGHLILYKGKTKKNSGPITIGNHVWIASYSRIAKNTEISNNSVIAQQSLVTKTFIQDGILIGGIPASVLSENIAWEG